MTRRLPPVGGPIGRLVGDPLDGPLRGGRRPLVAAGIWLGAVVAVATAAWFAIESAGRQVTGGTSTPSPVAVVDQVGATSPVATTGASPSAAGTTSTPATSGAPATTRGRRPGPRSIPGVYSTDGGRVRVSCLGPAVSLNGGYAAPASGWFLAVTSRGPERVTVAFWPQASGDQDAWRSPGILVKAYCDNGWPKFRESPVVPPDGSRWGTPPSGSSWTSSPGSTDGWRDPDGSGWGSSQTSPPPSP